MSLLTTLNPIHPRYPAFLHKVSWTEKGTGNFFLIHKTLPRRKSLFTELVATLEMVTALAKDTFRDFPFIVALWEVMGNATVDKKCFAFAR